MIYIFDLDDTLYDERQYVESGIRAVARMGEARWELPQNASYETLIALLDKNGRGRIFNDWLAAFHLDTKRNIKQCLNTYRLHEPDIQMPQAHLDLLASLPKPLYLVTDGNKVVQAKKVQALNISHYFKRVFITHRFGVQHAKPSTYCFEKIKQAEGCEWEDMVYIGDNPAKDFVNLKPLGIHTVRVLTGVHREIKKPSAYEASMTIRSLKFVDTVFAT